MLELFGNRVLIERQKERIDENGACQSDIKGIVGANSPEEVIEFVVFGSFRDDDLFFLFGRNHFTFFELWRLVVRDWDLSHAFREIVFITTTLFAVEIAVLGTDFISFFGLLFL